MDNTEKKQQARDLYLHTEKTQQEIADILNVNRRTIYLWIKHGKWEEIRIASYQAPAMIRQDIYNHIDNINAGICSRPPEDRCPTLEEVNKLQKLARTARYFGSGYTSFYLQAFQELITYIDKKDHELAVKVVTIADEYVQGNFGDVQFELKRDVNNNVEKVKNSLAKQRQQEQEDWANEQQL